MNENPAPDKKISRRTFVRQTISASTVAAATTAAGLWLHGRAGTLSEVPRVTLPSFDVARAPHAPVLGIARGKDREQLVRAAVDQLGGIETFIKKGDRVLIKPNVAFDRAPALGATTAPETLKAVAQLCFEAGAREVAVTDNPINSPEGCFHKSGIARATGEVNARLIMPTSHTFSQVHIGGKVLDEWITMSQPLLAADKLIGIAPCKDHNLSHASQTMKNWYGFLGGARNRFHQDIHTVIAELAMMIVPTLVFLDGTRVMVSNGPTGGSLSDIVEENTMVCGTDPVAVDAWGFENLLHRNINLLRYVHIATERGFGNMAWREIPYKETTI